MNVFQIQSGIRLGLGVGKEAAPVEKSHKERWTLDAVAHISCFLPPLTKVSRSATEMTFQV